MTIENTGEACLGQFDHGKQSGYAYCSRNYDDYDVQEQEITTLDYRKIPAYVTSATYEGELVYQKYPIVDKKGKIINPAGQYRSG